MNLSIVTLLNHHKHGYKFDLHRRGFEFKEDTTITDEDRKLYYTEEEIKLQKEALRKQYGNDIEGL